MTCQKFVDASGWKKSIYFYVPSWKRNTFFFNLYYVMLGSVEVMLKYLSDVVTH